jgi:hypothetical protein
MAAPASNCPAILVTFFRPDTVAHVTHACSSRR